MKKIFSLTAALAAAMLLGGCMGDKNPMQSDTVTSQSQTTTQSVTSNNAVTSATGDVDGDGFIEELGTDVNDIVSDVVTGVSDIAGDILGGAPNRR